MPHIGLRGSKAGSGLCGPSCHPSLRFSVLSKPGTYYTSLGPSTILIHHLFTPFSIHLFVRHHIRDTEKISSTCLNLPRSWGQALLKGLQYRRLTSEVLGSTYPHTQGMSSQERPWRNVVLGKSTRLARLISAAKSLWELQVPCPPGPLFPHLHGEGIGRGQGPAHFFCKRPNSKYL